MLRLGNNLERERCNINENDYKKEEIDEPETEDETNIQNHFGNTVSKAGSYTHNDFMIK